MAWDVVLKKQTKRDWSSGQASPPPGVKLMFESTGSKAPWIIAALSVGAAVFSFIMLKTKK